MSKRQFFSPISPVLSTVKSQGSLNKTMISGLFSKEFLGCLKNELSFHAKEIKPLDSDYKQALAQVKKYQKQKEAMGTKITSLVQSNRQLLKKLELYESDCGKQIDTEIESPYANSSSKITKILEIQQTVNINIMPGAASQEIQYLKERVQRLQVSKAIKDQRLNQMLQKQVRLESQINLLQVKNSQLEDQLTSLREAISRIYQQKAVTSTIVSARHPDIAISYHFDSAQTLKLSEKKESMNIPDNELNLMASFTNNVYIPDSLTLSKACLKRKLSECKEFNEIDYIIGEEMPYLNASDELKMTVNEQKPYQPQQMTNLNESVVLINLNNS